jgi:hypothetical protein
MKKTFAFIGAAGALGAAGWLFYKYVPTNEGSALDKAKDRVVDAIFKIRDKLTSLFSKPAEAPAAEC